MAIQSNFPTIRPSLVLDFANSKRLDPRITFTRGSTGTYYDGKTVAKAEENLFTDSAVIQGNYRPSTGFNTIPVNQDGSYTLTAATDNLFRTRGVSTPVGTVYTVSCFVSGTGTVRLIGINGNGGVFTSDDVVITLTATPTRYSWTGTNDVDNLYLGFWIRGAADNSTATVKVENMQLEFRNAPTPYTATTTQPITNYIPVLQTAAAGAPRFDHNPTTGESLGLLIEESRTNLFQRSEEFGNSAWGQTGGFGSLATVTSDTIIGPAGDLTADLITFTDNGSGQSRRAQNVSITTTTWYTGTVYVKRATSSNITFYLGYGNRINSLVNYNFDTDVVSTSTGNTIVSRTLVGNGWVRIRVTGFSFSTGTTAFGFLGGSSGSVYAWGAQLEAGTFATSYIQTVAASATRQADAASMTGTNFSSWYRADEGTLYGECDGTNSVIGTITDGTVNNAILLEKATGGRMYIAVNGTAVANAQTNTISGVGRVAVAYKVNDTIVAGNTLLSTLDTNLTIPVVNRLDIGVNTLSPVGITMLKKLTYYPSRLSNSILQAITG